MAQKLPSQDMGSRLVLQKIGQCSFFGDVVSEGDAKDLSKANDAAVRKEALASRR